VKDNIYSKKMDRNIYFDHEQGETSSIDRRNKMNNLLLDNELKNIQDKLNNPLFNYGERPYILV
jgi:uncharacterized protein YkwD